MTLGKRVYPKEEDHPLWKGDDIGYGGIHSWVEKHRGVPMKCDQCGTTKGNRFECANISGEYRRSNGLDDWKRLCPKCHKLFDNRLGEGNPISKLTNEQVLEIKKLYVPRNYSQYRLAKEFNITQSAVSLIVTGKRWGHICLR